MLYLSSLIMYFADLEEKTVTIQREACPRCGSLFRLHSMMA